VPNLDEHSAQPPTPGPNPPPNLPGSPRSPAEALASLAAACGLTTRYHDALGREHIAPPGAVAAVLRALGHDVDYGTDEASAQAAWAVFHERQSRAIVPPCAVAWADGAPGSFYADLLRWPAAAPVGAVAHLTLTLEDGTEWTATVARPAGAGEAAGGPKTATGWPVGEWPWPLPVGYHRLRATLEGVGEASAHILSAPARAAAGPARTVTPGGPEGGLAPLGLFAPLYALRRPGDWGTGDYPMLATLAQSAAEAGAAVVGTLPLFPVFLDTPFDPSPYAGASRLFWNELYIDLEREPEYAAVAADPALVKAIGQRRAFASLETRVEYKALYAVKWQALTVMARALAAQPADDPRRQAFGRWVEGHPLAREYAAFRAQTRALACGWPVWPVGAALPDATHNAGAQTHLYAQWLAANQLSEAKAAARARGVSLYLDLPLGAGADSFDTWRYRGQFLNGVSAGAPPDPLFEQGQDWGFPPLNPQAQRAAGYSYLRQSLAHVMSVADVLRMDHVMGLHRLYMIPHGFKATEGVYVPYPADELYAVLCIESARAGCALIGEDLGTVPAGVRETMAQRGLGRIWVFQFDAWPGEPPIAQRVPEGALACLNTHDIVTFAGFLAGLDIAEREAEGTYTPAEAAQLRHERAAFVRSMRAFAYPGWAADDAPTDTVGDVLAAASAGLDAGDFARRALARLRTTRAGLVLANLEDLWGEMRQQNWPGTSGTRPNWQHRTAHPVTAIPAVLGALGKPATAAATGATLHAGNGAGPEGHR